jgi:hypothetical protein
VWVRRLSYGDVDSLSAPGGDIRARNAAMISEAVRFGETGEEQMSYTDAYQLDPKLARALIMPLAEVNAMKIPKAKPNGKEGETTEEEPEDPKD